MSQQCFLHASTELFIVIAERNFRMCRLIGRLYHMVGIETNRALGIHFFASMAGLSTFMASTDVYCLFSEQITENLSDIGSTFYAYPWYRLPSKQQKRFMFLIRHAQNVFRITGLGIIECSLNVFLSVLQRVTLKHPIIIRHGH